MIIQRVKLCEFEKILIMKTFNKTLWFQKIVSEMVPNGLVLYDHFCIKQLIFVTFFL